jgi:hypothetical protein
VIVGDFQGYVHVLDPASGALVARTPSLDGRITQAPLIVGGLAIVITDRGRLAALRIRDLRPPAQPQPEQPPEQPQPEQAPPPESGEQKPPGE